MENSFSASHIAAYSGALLVFLVAQSLFRSGIEFFIGGDEYCRLNYAMDWAQQPFFSPQDHVWLAGQFYVLGGFIRILGHPRLVVMGTSLVGTLATVWFAGSLARRMWRSNIAAFFAGVLVGTERILLWSSVNPVAEVFMFPALLGALDCWLAGWQAAMVAGEEGGKTNGYQAAYWYLASAACVTFGTMFRYEMWYVGILLAAFLMIQILRISLKAGYQRVSLIHLVACLMLALYPLAWLASSWLELGSPLSFLETHTRLNKEMNLFYDFSSPLAALWNYPLALWLDHWPRLGLAAGGMVLAGMWRRKFAFPLVVAWGVLLLFSMVISINSGIGSNTRARYTEFLMLPLLCMGAGPLAMLANEFHDRRQWPLRGLVSIFLVLTGLTSWWTACESYPSAHSVHAGTLQLVFQLEHEGDSHRPQDDFLRIHPQGVPLEVFMSNQYTEFWMIRFHSQKPELITPVYSVEALNKRFQWAPVGTRFLVRQPRPQFAVLDRLQLLDTIPPYELWEVKKSQVMK